MYIQSGPNDLFGGLLILTIPISIYDQGNGMMYSCVSYVMLGYFQIKKAIGISSLTLPSWFYFGVTRKASTFDN